MNRRQTLELLATLSAYKPSQQVNELTVPAWAKLLAEVDYVDAEVAVEQLAGEMQWVSVNDIKARVHKIRADRIRRHGDPIPPAGLTVDEELAWMREAWRAVGDGGEVPGRGVHHQLDYDQREAIEAVRREVSR